MTDERRLSDKLIDALVKAAREKYREVEGAPLQDARAVAERAAEGLSKLFATVASGMTEADKRELLRRLQEE